jgi:hypothetical protein
MTTPRVDPGHEGGTPRRPRRTAAAAARAGPTPDAAPVSQAESEVKPASKPKPTRPIRDPGEAAEFFAKAIEKGSVAEACKGENRSLGEYVEARLEDPAFDEAALKVDRVLDMVVVDRVRQAAQQEGALAAQALYLKTVRLRAMQAPFPSLRSRPGPDDVPTMAPEVAAAIIKAGLEAHEKAVLGGASGGADAAR